MNIMPGNIAMIDFGVYKHLGIVSDRTLNGKPMIISNSYRKKGVFEEPWEEFSCNRKVTISDYTGLIDPYTVLLRARSKIGTRWNLFNWNCEHFVYWAHGLKAHSPQLNTYATCATILLASVILHKTIKTKAV